MQSNVYMAGATNSGTGTSIATPGSHQFAHSGNGSDDAFLVQFNNAGVRQWGTYYGSIGDDYGVCAVDNSGNVFLSGAIDTVDVLTTIATPASHQPAYGGMSDGFLVKFSGGCIPPPNPVNTTAAQALMLCTGMSTTLTAAGSGTVSWYDAATGGSVFGTGTVLVTPTLATGTHTWYAESFDCIPSQGRAVVTVTVGSCAGIAEQKGSTVCKVYPNPAGSAITISGENNSRYQLINVLGEVVLTGEHSQGKTTIQVQSLARGIYLLKLGDSGKSRVQKVILE
jgi:hypothetical protein